MEAVVAGGFTVRLLMPVLQSLGECDSLVLSREIEHRRRTACQRRSRSGGEIVRRPSGGHSHLQMSVGIDKAGEQDLSAGVDDFRIRTAGSEIFSDCRDLSVFNQNIRRYRVFRRDGRSSFDQSFHINLIRPAPAGSLCLNLTGFCRKFHLRNKKGMPEHPLNRFSGDTRSRRGQL